MVAILDSYGKLGLMVSSSPFQGSSSANDNNARAAGGARKLEHDPRRDLLEVVPKCIRKMAQKPSAVLYENVYGMKGEPE